MNSIKAPILVPVILSGGSGSRLWPVSRTSSPKPFMKLSDGQSLLEKTYRRAAGLPGVYQENGITKLLTVTNRDYYSLSYDELQKAGVRGTFLLEPCSRNTAPAIALAAHRIREKLGPEALMLVLAADHLILDEVAFSKAVEQAVQLAGSPHKLLVTFGVVPTGPETGFGYIEAGQAIGPGQIVNRFVEKPDSTTAQAYLDAGNYFWNSGMFCFSAGQFLEELSLCAPEVSIGAKACWQDIETEGMKDLSMIEISEELFKVVPDISVDYAVMEKSSKVAVISGNFGWSDIGSWDSIRDLVAPDSQNNRASGEAIFVKTDNTFVRSENRLVATVGVTNLMIIDTADALLVANQNFAQEVKTVVSLLKDKNNDTYKLHQTITRPWGTYTVLQDSPGFKIKRLEVRPGGRLSLQSHKYRSEHWVVVKGQAQVLNNDKTVSLLVNESIYIPAGHKHRLENPTDQALVIIEVQCGEYLGEDDIERFEDIYGRG